MPTISIHENDGSQVQWRLVCQTRSGTFYLHAVELLQDDTGSTVLEKLRKEYYRIKAQAPYNSWDKIILFLKPVLEVVTISENSAIDLENQNAARRVIVSSRERDPELTTAFCNPEILSAAEGFVERNARFAVHPTSPRLQDGRRAIMIGHELNRLGLWTIALTMMVLCIGLGVLVGFLTKSVDLGVAVTSGIATVAACVQVFSF